MLVSPLCSHFPPRYRRFSNALYGVVRMLDRTKNERACVGITEFEWLDLSKIERRLIHLYRLLDEREQLQLRRMSEVLAINPKESANS